MNLELWSRIKAAFGQLVEQSPERRAALLSELCQGDVEVQSEVERLLAGHDAMGGFLEGTPSITAGREASLLQSGEVVAGRYEIIALLGRGGMGEVYEAQDRELKERIAIKMIVYEDLMERLRREVQLARRVTHPSVCRIFDLGYHQHAGRELIFLTMELIKGETLNARLGRQGRIATSESLPIARQLCAALAAAHRAGILHRDFKCGNVMLLGSGSEVRAVVTDFGIARPIQSRDETQGPATQPGMVMGTPTYMSPEQLMGEKLGAASDLYSLGLVLYEMVTGVRPFHGESSWTEALKRLSSDPAPPIEVVPDLDPRWNRTIVRCLQRDPAQRFAIAEEVWESLQHRFRYSWKDLSPVRRVAVLCFLFILAAGAGVAAIPLARHSLRSLWVRITAPNRGGEPAVADEPYALRKQAQIYLDRWDLPDNLDRAIAMLNRALELDHNYAPAYASLTFAYYARNRLNPDPQWVKQAAESADRALQINSDLADAHVAAGVAAMMGGRNDEAGREFRRSSDLDPKNAKPHDWLGLLFITSANNQKAEGEFLSALALNPEDWRALMNLGVLRYNAARYPEAAADWAQVSKLTPANFAVLRNLAAAYHMMGRDDDAASSLQRSLEIKPDAATYSNLGTWRFFQGHYDEAVSAFESAVRLGANQYVFWGNLGDAYRWAPGQAAKAKSAYENAIRLAHEALAATPDDADLKSSLALYLVKNGNRQAALIQIREVDSMAEKPPSVLFNSAVVYELSGERAQALAALSAALKAGYSLNEVKQEPELVGLRSDAHYQLLLADLPVHRH